MLKSLYEILANTALLCFFVLCFPFSALSKENKPGPSTASRLEKFQASAKKPFKVGLKQEFYSALRKKSEASVGELEFAPPKSFRWSMKTPKTVGNAIQFKSEIYVSNGKEFWKYNESAKHAVKYSSNIKELDFLDVILNPAQLAKTYNVEEWKNGTEPPPDVCKDRLCVALESKETLGKRKLFLILNEKSGWVEELRIVYQDGNRAVLRFEDHKIGEIAKGRFDFTPPPGTAVDNMQ